MLDLDTLRTQLVPPLERVATGAMNYNATAVGRRWVEVTAFGYHWSLRRSLRIADGAVRRVDSGRALPDLDGARVARPLCAPLRRPRNPAEGIENDPRYGTGVRRGRWTVYAGRRGVHAWRCGRRSPVRLSTCRLALPGWRSPDVGRNFAAWTEGDGLRVATLQPRRRRTLATPGTHPVPAVTGRRLLVSVPLPGGAHRVYVRARPR